MTVLRANPAAVVSCTVYLNNAQNLALENRVRWIKTAHSTNPVVMANVPDLALDYRVTRITTAD